LIYARYFRNPNTP